MSEEKKSGRYEWQEPKDINTKSDDFRAGYHQGYIDGMESMADKVIERLHKINSEESK